MAETSIIIMLKACEIDDYDSLFSHAVRSSHKLPVSEVSAPFIKIAQYGSTVYIGIAMVYQH